jgi:hypothetical protein
MALMLDFSITQTSTVGSCVARCANISRSSQSFYCMSYMIGAGSARRVSKEAAGIKWAGCCWTRTTQPTIIHLYVKTPTFQLIILVFNCSTLSQFLSQIPVTVQSSCHKPMPRDPHNMQNSSGKPSPREYDNRRRGSASHFPQFYDQVDQNVAQRSPTRDTGRTSEVPFHQPGNQVSPPIL